jgi:uncharacterized protein YbjT (DUF2867 family)
MILLTGATGIAGSFIVDEFVRQQEPVRVLVRNRKKATELEKVTMGYEENQAEGVAETRVMAATIPLSMI